MRSRNFFGEDYEAVYARRQKGKRFFGIGVALIGVLLFLRALGVLSMLSFSFTWPVILLVVGFLIGLRHNFRNNAWWILMLIGVANLTPEFTIMGRPSEHFVWPTVVIIAGLAIALRPRKERCFNGPIVRSGKTTDGKLDVDVTFGGRKELITDKDFQGGTISVTFGGCELNLSRADFAGPSAVLDFRVSFGGVEMVVPSHWEIQNEVSPSFGSVEDERTVQTNATFEERKVLILRGNVSFGSIEIKSY